MMKKITFLLILLTVSFGYSQEIAVNGDFETGVGTPWYNNAVNVVDDGSTTNFINQAEVLAAGNPWDANISQDVVLTDGSTYEFSFDAYTDATTSSRPITVGIGQNSGAFAASTVVQTITATLTTYTLTLDANYGGAAASRILFDMGAATGFVFLDNVSLMEVTTTCNNGVMDGDETGVDCGGATCPACETDPTAVPTAPTHNETTNQVISIFSDTYTNLTGTNYDPDWGQATDATIELIGADEVLKYANLNYQGTEYTAQDVSGLDKLHVDYWTTNATSIDFFLISTNGAVPPVSKEASVSLPITSTDTWLSIDIDLSSFVPPVDLAQAYQFKVVGNATIWLDNLYFYNSVPLGVEDFSKTSFSVYPNPSQNSWTVKTVNVTMSSIQVFDVLGKKVLSLSPNASETVINGSNLKSGLYFAQIKTATGINSIKLIKN